MSIDEVIGDPFQFLDQVFQDLRRQKIDVSAFELDHVCYRTTTLRNYEEKKQELTRLGRLLVEDFVNGRPIATYKLHSPIHYYERKIDVIEVPAPKAGRPYPEGLEHIEMVDKSLSEERVVTLANGLVVKFHGESLERIIAREKAERNARLRLAPPRAAIFDLDGTLVAAGRAFDQVLQKVLSYHLDREVTLSEIVEKHAPNYHALFALFGLKDALQIQRIISEMGDLWHFAKGDIYLFDGIETVLNMARDEKIDLYVWTARDQVSVHRTLQTLDIENYFKQVFCFNPETGGKPEPTNEQRTLFKTYGQRIAMIGDSSADREGAARLGVSFIDAQWERQPMGPGPLDMYLELLKIVNV